MTSEIKEGRLFEIRTCSVLWAWISKKYRIFLYMKEGNEKDENIQKMGAGWPKDFFPKT